MNWIFDTYSTVYRTAMLQSQDSQQNAAPAKERVHAKSSPIFGIFRRRG
jgi:hypothetical protein